ncbi:hypothetical protein [Actinomadura formosensis]|uniref:hypothetical protein n=1 Tax=Actinomadura formosensis TaxID=60706 RepID=UPI000833EB01|nr:hypothetical protein [Actinomadura formosensis]
MTAGTSGGAWDALPGFVQADRLVHVGAYASAGGQSTRLTRCVGPDGGEYVFKSYTPEVRESVRPDALAAMTSWRLGLSAADRAELDRRCAWPRAVVMDGREVQGVLMRPAPVAMFEVANGRTRTWSLPRHLDALARSEGQARKLGFDYYPAPVKLAVLGRMLRTMLWLHERGYAVGDLQPRNALFSFDGRAAEVLLVDCDACVPLSGEPAHAPRDPEAWKAPGSGPFGVRTDMFKFAWLVVRSLQENTVSTALDPGRLRAVMQSRTCDVLVELCAGRHPADAVALLRDKASVWPALVTPHALYVQTDDSMRRQWRPDGAPPATAPPATAAREESAATAAADVSSGTEIPAGFVAAVVLAVVFIALVLLLS